MSGVAARSPRLVAMDYLSRREHSLHELRRKLAAKDFTPDEIEATLADLAREGLASDARFAEAFTRWRARRGQGPQRIRADLESRGVAADVFGEFLEQPDWDALATAERVKKYGPEPPADYKERARQGRFLQYRGFTGEQIRRALGGNRGQD